MFGAGRALLLQLAHPHVAAGVDEHSDFQNNPFKRLQGTLEAVYTMVYGQAELADGVGRRVRWIHDFVTGPAYRANDPENLLWVHATLLDSAVSCYERLVAPLTDDERETYYQEMVEVAERFGCPRDRQPATWSDFRGYWDATVAAMEVTDAGRRLARDVIEPTHLPLNLHCVLGWPLSVQRLVSIGTLPPVLRERFGYDWTDDDERRLRAVHARARRIFRLVPKAVRVGPVHLNGRILLRQARSHVAAFDEKVAVSASA